METNIVDLQIFLTRSPRYQTNRDESLPSFIFSGEGREQASHNYRPTRSAQDVSNEIQQEGGYIAIANSCAVEEVTFPFSSSDVRRIVADLSGNSAHLNECISFGVGLFDFAIHGSIRDLFRELSSQDKILRLTISTSIPELAVLPWELMCDNKSGSPPQFLCFNPKIRFCRALHLFNRESLFG